MTQAPVAVFDAYGTLFDVHSAVARVASRLGPDAGEISELWRQKQLEYTWTRSLMGRYLDFQAITEAALDYAMAASKRADPGLRAELLAAYARLDPYPEVPEVLAGYRAMGMRVAVFSNATGEMLQTALRAARLESLIDATVSVHGLRVFKPAPAVYGAAADALGTTAGSIRFHSSNAWDAAGASACGWQSFWVNRGRRPSEYAGLPVREVVDLATALRQAQPPDACRGA